MKFLTSSYTLALCLVGAPAIAAEVTTNNSDLIVNTKGGFSVETADGNYSMKLGGRIQYDYNRAEQNGLVDEDGFDIRRARLYVSGDVMDWGYKIQFNIGGTNGGTPEDLYIRYNGFENMAITIGHQKESIGLEQLTSSKDNTFLERTAAIEAYTPGRSDGIQVEGSVGELNYALGVFEDDFSGTGKSDFSITGRVAGAVIHTTDLLVHLGLAHTERGADVSTTGLEAALVSGPLHLQSEYFASDKAGTNYDGYYVQAGWILTGESRPYAKGVFGRVKPEAASGAWEVVVRYESGDADYGDIELGHTDATALGFGVNWYANAYTRIGLDYTSGDDQNSSDTGSEVRARFQFAF